MFYLNINLRIKIIDSFLKLVNVTIPHQSFISLHPFHLHPPKKMMNPKFAIIWHLFVVIV